MKYCPSCGEANPDEAKFCGKCGNAMPTTTPPPTQQHHHSTPPHQTPPSAGVPSGTKNGILVLSLIIPLIGIIMGIIYMNDANAEKKAVGKTWLWVSLGALVFWCFITTLLGNAGF